MMPTSTTAKLILGLFIILLAWWGSIAWRGLIDTAETYFFGLAMTVIPAVGGIAGIWLSKQWGFHRSAMGRGVLFQSLGLVAWAIGTLIFAYYNLALAVEVPYPSWADAAYIFGGPLWIIGMYNISQVTGARYSLREMRGKIIAFLLLLVTLAAATFLVVQVGLGGEINLVGESVLETLLNYLYPVDSVVVLTTAILVYGLSYRYLGGVYKFPLYLILFAFVLRYCADLAFSITTANETFFVASWVDVLFLTYISLVSFGLHTLAPRSVVREKSLPIA